MLRACLSHLGRVIGVVCFGASLALGIPACGDVCEDAEKVLEDKCPDLTQDADKKDEECEGDAKKDAECIVDNEDKNCEEIIAACI